MKLFRKIISVLTLVLVLQTPVMANQNIIKDVIRQETLELAQEKSEILNMVRTRPDETAGILKSAFGNRQINLKTEQMIKVYGLNEDLVKAYRSGKKFGELISNKYVWNIPIQNESNEIESLATVIKGKSVEEAKKSRLNFQNEEDEKEYLSIVESHAGKWFIAMIGGDIPIDDLNFVTGKDKVAAFLESEGINNPSTIKYVKTGRFNTNILYVKQGNEEYGVPFSSRPDFTGLKNGKLYKISEIASALDKAYGYNPQERKGYGGGGSGSISDNSDNKSGINKTGIAVVSISLIGIVGIYMKKKKSAANEF